MYVSTDIVSLHSFVYMYVCMYVSTDIVSLHSFVYTVCTYVCMFVCIYACMYVSLVLYVCDCQSRFLIFIFFHNLCTSLLLTAFICYYQEKLQLQKQFMDTLKMESDYKDP